ncbi:MAG: NAD(P)H-dependent oxidoreductase [Planctomycetota bacterium]
MNITVISSSGNPQSRSERIALMCGDLLRARGVETSFVKLTDCDLGRIANDEIIKGADFDRVHALTLQSDGLVLASPVYNWGCCSELKRYVELIGSTNGQHRGAFFDKTLTFVNAAGLPHSYMSYLPLANSMMLDFKCVVNPYNVYVHNRHWDGDTLVAEAQSRINKSLDVMMQLTQLLAGRTYQSNWEI